MHAFYYLAAYPEYMKPLREEVEEIIQREGWTKAGLDQMCKLDSFIKESLRLHPSSLSKPMSYIAYAPKVNAFSVAMQRVAVDDYTFTDGTTVPRGTALGVALDSVHLNDKIYPDPLTFDPFRFVKLKEQDASGRKFDMATTSNDSLPFSHGRHACPGRYFAACELKLMFGHLLTNYDVKLENEGVRPRDLWIVGACVPNPNAKVLFRKRVL
jgi:cytochrome P450